MSFLETLTGRIVMKYKRQINELPKRIASSVDFVNAVKNGDRQVAQITFNDDMVAIVAAMLEEEQENRVCADILQ